MTTEAIMAALFTQATSSALFKTKERRWQSWQDDPNQNRMPLPAIILYQMNETTVFSGRGMPAVQTWLAHILVYGMIPMILGVPDKTTPGATVLNPLVDAVRTALAPPTVPLNSNDADGCQTLGGLVYDCRIEGVTTLVLGDQDPSGLCGAIIPVKILVP